MKSIILYIAMAILIFCAQELKGQDKEIIENKIEKLQSQKETVIKNEKEKLKEEVESINRKLNKGEITKKEAKELKEEVAKKRALNIENRLAIINNQIELLKRNEQVETVSVDVENDTSEIVLFGFNIKDSKKKRKPKYDKRTYKDLVVAFGVNNALGEGQSLSDSDFKIAGSRFFEIGWAWKTRVFKNSNWLRIKYGISYQSNGLKPTDNRYFVENGENTTLEEFRVNLDKSKFRMDNLILPIHFELGPSRVVKTEEKIRYSIHRKFRIGLGGFLGANISTRQKLKYRENGDRIKDKIKRDYNTRDFIYGVSAYAGFGDMSLYFKYDVSPIFEDPNLDLNNVSLGLRFDL